jgi:metal-responsive CopG/Arc/MetJ family transcriptional regulator
MRPGRRLEHKANVTITLPLQLLDKIDDYIEQGKAVSRSQLIRDVLEKYMKRGVHEREKRERTETSQAQP